MDTLTKYCIDCRHCEAGYKGAQSTGEPVYYCKGVISLVTGRPTRQEAHYARAMECRGELWQPK